MSGVDERPGERERLWQRCWRGASSWRKRWIRGGVGLAFFLGCILLFGLIISGRQAAPRRAGTPLAASPGPPTAFPVLFAQAQRSYLRAQMIAKQKLEALEEWDPDSIRGSTPEIYRKSFIAGTQEIGLARSAAREASRRAKTNDEAYRAARLLAYIERDMGHRRAELEQAKKLVALKPHNPEAWLLLERAARDCREVALAHRAQSEVSRLLGYPAGSGSEDRISPQDSLEPPPSGSVSGSPRSAPIGGAQPR
jgi:hypothetical protein